MDEPLMTNSSGETAHELALVSQGPRNEVERQAMALAQEFFPGPAVMEDATDPEDPSWHRRVIVVTASGTPKEMIAREREWDYRVIAELGARADNILLQFNFVDPAS
jgi:hypothetical protein